MIHYLPVAIEKVKVKIKTQGGKTMITTTGKQILKLTGKAAGTFILWIAKKLEGGKWK